MPLTISATDTEAQKPVNVFYNQMLLRNARPLAPYFIGTKPTESPMKSGASTVKWRRYNTSADNASGIAPTTTALSELTGTAAYMQGRDASTVHFTDVTATLNKYGQFYILNEEVDVFLPNGTMMGITQTLAISAGRSLNYLQRNIVEDNATLVYVGSATNDATSVSKIDLTSIASVINTLTRNSGMPFTAMGMGSENVGTSPILPGYWLLCHPDVAYDISQIAGFKSSETYGVHTELAPGEFGLISSAGFSVRCIQTPEASIDIDSGGAVGSTGLRSDGAANIDLYTVSIYGMDALGSVGLGKMHTDGVYRGGDNQAGFEIIAKGRGTGRPSGTDDPFDEIMTLSWKAWHAGAVLNSNWVRGIRCGATAL